MSKKTKIEIGASVVSVTDKKAGIVRGAMTEANGNVRFQVEIIGDAEAPAFVWYAADELVLTK